MLGETSPDRMVKRLRKAAAPFARRDSKVQPVFELIVTVADAGPGDDRDFNHDIARADVQRYIDAAHEHGALLLLDIQPGRSGFLSVVRRWKWALEDPYVGLALDPEWRMGRRGVPGRRIGSVTAAEVDRVVEVAEHPGPDRQPAAEAVRPPPVPDRHDRGHRGRLRRAAAW